MNKPKRPAMAVMQGVMKPKREIQVEVVFTPGYEKRFTEACLKQLGKDAVKRVMLQNGDGEEDEKKVG